jgi:NAD+ kinase
MVLDPERDARPVLKAVRRWAWSSGTTVLVADDAAARDQLPADSDLLIAAGGHGTMLDALRLAAPQGTPVLGVNELELRGLGRGLEAVARGDFSVESQTALTVHHGRGGPLTAFKDVIVSRRLGRSEAVLALHVDGELISRQAGDGLIVASPAGSAAHSLSAEGPIVSPRLEAILVTPLAPHAVLSSSLVLPPDEPIILKVLRNSSALALEIDGREHLELPPDSRLILEAAPHAGRVVRLGQIGFAAHAQTEFGAREAA